MALKVKGDFEEEFQLFWSDKMTAQIQRSWSDTKKAAEYGSIAIAAILLPILLEFEILSQTKQGTTVDYQIGNPADFRVHALLEVSGLLKETTKNTLNVRVNVKKAQVDKRLDKLPVFIIVTEFGEPKTKIIKNE